jgi:hypothetical protein
VVAPSQGDAGEGARPASAGRAPATSPPPGPLSTAPADQADPPLLRLRGIGKRFGPVQALADIDLDVPVGQVTALVGDNGAGKTTLIKCLAGIWEPSGGEMLGTVPVRLHSPRDATWPGSRPSTRPGALRQPDTQNMLLGHEPPRRGLPDEITMEKTAKATPPTWRSPRSGRSARPWARSGRPAAGGRGGQGGHTDASS